MLLRGGGYPVDDGDPLDWLQGRVREVADPDGT
jgi:hypothetical protein